MQKHIILLHIIFLITISAIGCKDDQALINASHGIYMHQMPDIDSEKIFLLPRHSVVAILDEKGPEDIVNHNKGNWIKIRFGHEEGWVFNKYIIRKIPNHYKKINSYVSSGNSTAYIYLILYNNKTFNFHFKSMLGEDQNLYTFQGTWGDDNDLYKLKFNKNLPCAPRCKIEYFFINQEGRRYDDKITMNNNHIVTFPKGLGKLFIWGVSCLKE